MGVGQSVIFLTTTKEGEVQIFFLIATIISFLNRNSSVR